MVGKHEENLQISCAIFIRSNLKTAIVYYFINNIIVYNAPRQSQDVCYYAKPRILKQIIDLMINIVCNKNIRSTSMGEGCG